MCEVPDLPPLSPVKSPPLLKGILAPGGHREVTSDPSPTWGLILGLSGCHCWSVLRTWEKRRHWSGRLRRSGAGREGAAASNPSPRGRLAAHPPPGSVLREGPEPAGSSGLPRASAAPAASRPYLPRPGGAGPTAAASLPSASTAAGLFWVLGGYFPSGPTSLPVKESEVGAGPPLFPPPPASSCHLVEHPPHDRGGKDGRRPRACSCAAPRWTAPAPRVFLGATERPRSPHCPKPPLPYSGKRETTGVVFILRHQGDIYKLPQVVSCEVYGLVTFNKSPPWKVIC